MKHLKKLIVLCTFLGITISYNTSFVQAQFWQQTKGPYGGGFKTLAIGSCGNVFVASDDYFRKGFYHSSNYGKSWEQISIGLTDLYIRSLLIHPNGFVFAGTWTTGNDSGIYRSTDNGKTWQYSGLKYKDVEALTLSKDGIIYAGTHGSGIYRSSNIGES